MISSHQPPAKPRYSIGRDQGALNPTWKGKRKDVAEGTVQRERGLIQGYSKMLGHSSVQVTQRHYAFIAPDDVGAKVLAVMEPGYGQPSERTRRAAKRREKGRDQAAAATA